MLKFNIAKPKVKTKKTAVLLLPVSLYWFLAFALLLCGTSSFGPQRTSKLIHVHKTTDL